MEARLDARAVRRWADLAVAALEGARERIDAANVFPVADADTGTNMLLTLVAARRAVGAGSGADDRDGAGDGAGALADLARGALIAARGNSGIILSELLRGIAVGADGSPDVELTGGAVARLLRSGAEAARAAVARPAPGTMLTAADAAAAAALDAAAEGATPLGVLDEALGGARSAVLGSTDELDVLARHGLVDAGAFGLTLVLAALRDALADAAPGGRAARAPGADVGLPADLAAAGGRRECADPHGAEPDAREPDGAYEVMYVVEGPATGATAGGAGLADHLRARLRAIGESVVVVGGDVLQAHVHTDDPAAALEAARDLVVRQVCVRSLLVPPAPVGVVAGVRSPGLLAEAAGTGAVVLARTDLPWRPDELARVLEDTGREEIVAILRADSVATLRTSLDELAAARVETVVVPDDLHVVAALTAREESLGGGGDPRRALAAMRAAVDALRWCSTDLALAAPASVTPASTTPAPAAPDAVVPDAVSLALAGLARLGRPEEVGLALVLAGADVPDGVLVACRAYLVDALGCEVVELPSGRRDAVLRVGLL